MNNIEKKLKKNKRNRMIGLIVLAVVLLIIFFFLFKQEEKLVQVQSDIVERRDITSTLNLNSEIIPSNIQDVTALNQEVKKIHVELGQRVKKGDLLLELDTKKLKENYEEASKTLDSANEAMQGAIDPSSFLGDSSNLLGGIDFSIDTSGIGQDISASIEDAITRAAEELGKKLDEKIKIPDDFSFLTEEQKLELYNELMKALKNLQNELPETETEPEPETDTEPETDIESSTGNLMRVAAGNDLSSLLNNNGSIENAFSQAGGLTSQLQLSKSSAKKALDNAKTKVYAEYNGLIVNINAKEGELVETTEPILSLYDDSSLEISLGVNRYDAKKIKKDQDVIFKSDDLELKGKVSFVSPIATKNNNNSLFSNIEGQADAASVKVTLKITSGKTDELIIGFPIDAYIITDKKENVLTVPTQSILSEQEKNYVYLLKDNLVSKRYIETGIESELYVEVIEGLEEGDRVVLNPPSDLEENQKVSIDE
ncbi:MAG: hypothetical protein CSB16_00545 [Clostridiales bacterium]|nr:MAG: hypothetical protein CSB16_00545 [Clostridiales bacterium]